MYEPIRGGTRGGQAEFKWTDVSADKDRENYLGHSINAPTGRWQKNKDVHWYNRDLKDSEFERLEEIRKIKEAEADALAVALGFTPEPKQIKSELSGEASEDKTEDPKLVIEKEERRRRKEAKRAKKEAKRERKEVKRE
ncbi:kinase phosphorylation protein-domain-containing protein [Rhodocollybia butyracea]|uniref:Kinase phosphorylation protein-domain-containing protein n=1 Tax=Rhodocollybia butyracea TaxID=206335 RepID=A0A9P5PTU1_9AGAR|nr:kinase phosphorylation protein-domain-containing protein [Rhodocollybia butyracea]